MQLPDVAIAAFGPVRLHIRGDRLQPRAAKLAGLSRAVCPALTLATGADIWRARSLWRERAPHV